VNLAFCLGIILVFGHSGDVDGDKSRSFGLWTEFLCYCRTYLSLKGEFLPSIIQKEIEKSKLGSESYRIPFYCLLETEKECIRVNSTRNYAIASQSVSLNKVFHLILNYLKFRFGYYSLIGWNGHFQGPLGKIKKQRFRKAVANLSEFYLVIIAMLGRGADWQMSLGWTTLKSNLIVKYRTPSSPRMLWLGRIVLSRTASWVRNIMHRMEVRFVPLPCVKIYSNVGVLPIFFFTFPARHVNEHLTVVEETFFEAWI